MLLSPRALLLAAAFGLAAPAGAAASITLAYDAQRPALRVDERGNAEVSWTAGGTRRYLLVPPAGRVYPGRRLAGADVSRPGTAAAVPFRRVLRRTPDGRLWALQAWRVKPGGPIELRFSRWRGKPPEVTLASKPLFNGELVFGRATFGGRPVPLTSPTPEGKRLRSYVYLDRLVGSSWQRIGGVATRADGTYRRLIRASELGSRYRAVVTGPNIGTTLAPDAVSVGPSRLARNSMRLHVEPRDRLNELDLAACSQFPRADRVVRSRSPGLPRDRCESTRARSGFEGRRPSSRGSREPTGVSPRRSESRPRR